MASLWQVTNKTKIVNNLLQFVICSKASLLFHCCCLFLFFIIIIIIIFLYLIASIVLVVAVTAVIAFHCCCARCSCCRHWHYCSITSIRCTSSLVYFFKEVPARGFLCFVPILNTPSIAAKILFFLVCSCFGSCFSASEVSEVIPFRCCLNGLRIKQE